MRERARDFVEAGRLAELAALTGDGRPALLFSADGERLIWANLAGARFLNARSVDAVLRLSFTAASPIARRLPALMPLLANGIARTERITLPRGLLSAPVICKASRIILGQGRGVLLQVADGSGVLPAHVLASELNDFLAGAEALAAEAVAPDVADAPDIAVPVASDMAAATAEPVSAAVDPAETPDGPADDAAPVSLSEPDNTSVTADAAGIESDALPVAFAEAGADTGPAGLLSPVADDAVTDDVAPVEPEDAVLDRVADTQTVLVGEAHAVEVESGVLDVEIELPAADSAPVSGEEIVVADFAEASGVASAGDLALTLKAETGSTDGTSALFEARDTGEAPDEDAIAPEDAPVLVSEASDVAEAAPAVVEDAPVALEVTVPAVTSGIEAADAAGLVLAETDVKAEADGIAVSADEVPEAETEAPAEELAVEETISVVPEAVPTEAGPPAFVFPSHGRTVRFVFELDGDNRFGSASGELAETVGPQTSNIAGQAWPEVAARLGLDPGGRISAALDRRDTFTGMTVDWPVSDRSMRVPIDLAGLPVFGRDRSYRGYRGFGVIKTGAAFEISKAFGGLTLVEDAPSAEIEAATVVEVAEDLNPDAVIDTAMPAALLTEAADTSEIPATAAEPAAVDLIDDMDGDYTDPADLARLDGVDPESLGAREPGDENGEGAAGGAVALAASALTVGMGTAAAVVPIEESAGWQEDISAESGASADEAASETAVGISPEEMGAGTDAGAVLVPEPADAETTVAAVTVADDADAGGSDLAEAGTAATDATSRAADAGEAVVESSGILQTEDAAEAEITEADADLGDLAVLDGADSAAVSEDAEAGSLAFATEVNTDSFAGTGNDSAGEAIDAGETLEELSDAGAEEPADAAIIEETEGESPAFAAAVNSGGFAGTADDSASETAYADETREELSDAAADEPAVGIDPEVGPEKAADAGAVIDLGDDEASFAPLIEEPDAHLVGAVGSLSTGTEPAYETPARDGEPTVAEPVAALVDRSALAVATAPDPLDESLIDDEASVVEPDAPDIVAETAAGIAGALPESNTPDGNDASEPEHVVSDSEGLTGRIEHAADAFLEGEGDETASAEQEGRENAGLLGGAAPADAPDGVDADAIPAPVPDGAEIIASPIIPRLRPREVLSADEEARRQLSKPERDAFNKIAEALGARIDGDAALAEDVPAAGIEAGMPAGEVEAVSEAAAEVPAVVGGLDRTVLDRLPISIALLKDGEAVYMNKALLALAGYPDFATFQDEGGFASIFAGSALPRDASLPAIRRRDGVEVPVSAQLHRIPVDGGSASLMVLQDLASATGRARANDAEQRVDELEAILDTATDGVLILDQRGAIMGANQSAEALFGRDKAAMIGEALVSLLAPESHRAALDYLDGLGRNGLSSVLNDGREVIGRVEPSGLVPLFMTVGRVGAHKFCAVLRDITQWKRAEEELTNAKRSAETASSQKSDFLAKISHEIRTPLNAIIGFSEVMMEERFGPVGSERYKEYLRDIHLSGAHIMSLVNDLLDLSKIEAGKLELAFEAVDANDIIRECVALMQPQANRERIIIRNSLSSSLPNIVADNRSLRQIILNLLSNAIKFNTTGGQVIISTLYEDTGEVAIRVRDTGPGMSEDEIAKAMEPFRQLHTTRPGRGTGLGLPLTKALVEANRAGFRIDSAPGQGTLVQITFPSTRVLAE